MRSRSPTIGPVHVHGAAVDPRPPVRLRAGDLSALLEPETGFLRSITIDGRSGVRREILRGVYGAVRDHNWRTLVPEISELAIDESASGFSVTFTALCAGEGAFAWTGRITGEESGTLRYEMDGTVLSRFRRNRIGLCVLHPAECAGRACTVETVDGDVRRMRFPRHISPHQPFKDLRAISCDLPGGGRAEVRFEGDTFETEDQRNWTDASFKTYSTPLELPFPVEVQEGEKVRQTVTLSVRDAAASGPSRPAAEPIAVPTARRLLVRADEGRPPPEIGLGSSSAEEPLTDLELERLAALRPSHLRLDLRRDSGGRRADWRRRLERAAEETRRIGARLEVALFLSEEDADGGLAAFADAFAEDGARLSSVLLFDRNGNAICRRWAENARRALESVAPGARIASGSNAYFAQFNRDRPPVDVLDAVCYSMNPHVHAFDNASLVETLPAQATTVESARCFCGNLPIIVTPVTLRPRFNPTATAAEPEPAEGELPPQVDPRQLSLFGAAWTLGSIKHLTAGGAAGVTYYEAVGWRGVMERDAGSRLPEKFPSLPASVFPLYHVLAAVGEFVDGVVMSCTSSHPSEFEGLVLEKTGRRRVLIAGFTGEARRVLVETGAARRVMVRRLDRTSIEGAMRSPEDFRARACECLSPTGSDLELEIPPYSVLCVDLEEAGYD